jgi:threonine aldolase
MDKSPDSMPPKLLKPNAGILSAAIGRPVLFFASDNSAGAHPKISEALSKHSIGYAAPYGDSNLDKKVQARFSEIFEREVSVFFVGTGTAANSLAIAAEAKPGGIALCHSGAHVIEDECGAPELYSGCRLAPVGGQFGKIDPNLLREAFGQFIPGFVHHGRPTMVTITQVNETGCVYSLDEVREIKTIASNNNVSLHMDGARFANGLVALGASPAEMTWKAGIDYLSFGGTKNGCWCAEALVCFDLEKAEEIHFLRKRAGQLFSKSRFIAAQFDVYFADDLWLELAQHSNQMAAKLASHIAGSSTMKLGWKPEANEVFALMTKEKAAALRSGGAQFYEFPIPAAHRDMVEEGQDLYRFVTSFSTTEQDVEDFARLL